MKSIGDMLRSELSDDNLEQIGRSIGADRQHAGRAVEEALPELLEQLKRNAGTRGGLESLEGAIDRDHDGSIFDRLPEHLENPDGGNGGKILEHIFGKKRGQIESQLGQRTGIDAGGIGKLLVTLAPLLLGMLGKAKRGGGGGLGDILGGGGSSRGGCMSMLLPLLGKFVGGRR